MKELPNQLLYEAIPVEILDIRYLVDYIFWFSLWIFILVSIFALIVFSKNKEKRDEDNNL